MSPHTVGALVLRYIYLYTRSGIRLIELFFWPLTDLVVWGFLTVYLQQNTAGDMPRFITFLIGGMILWDVLFRSQQGIAMSFLEDVWTRNLLNVFAAPVRTVEYLAAAFTVGFLRIVVTLTLLTIVAKALYAFNLFDLKLGLLVFLGNLLLFGWTLGMVSTALILRWGQAAESLAWAVPFLLQPLAAVFYPVTVLPAWLQPVAWCLPATYVFEGMRGVLRTGIVDWQLAATGFALNLVFLALSGTFFARILASARERGLLVKFAAN
jgi:ABC-2 type transport system permease protein